MYDLDVMPLADTPIVQNLGDDVCVLVGDNITIQEHPKKVRFALPPSRLQPEPDTALPLTQTSDVSAAVQTIDVQTSLFAVDGTFGTNYDMPCPPAHDISLIVGPPSIQQEMEALPWKTKVALKACYAIGFSIPFIMVAAIQPWKTG